MNPNNNTDPNATTPVDPSIEPSTQAEPADQPEQTSTPAPEVPVDSTPETPDTPDASPTPTVDYATPPIEPTVAPVETPNEQPVTPDPAVTSSASPPTETPANTGPAAPATAAAVGAVSTAAVTDSPEGPKKPSNAKKIILIAAIAGGVLLLTVIGIITYLLLTHISKDDYRAAARQYNEVTRSNSALMSDVSRLGYSTSSATDARFDEAVSSAEEAIADIKTENDELGELKAVRFGEGAKLYDTFDDKLEAYLAYATEIVTSVKNVRPALATCSDVNDATDETSRVTALKECADSLGEAKDIPNPEFKTFIASLKTAYGDYATTYEKLTAITDPFGSQREEYRDLRDKMSETQDKISVASKKFADDLETRDDELSVKESADALTDYLTAKQQ